MLSLGPAVRVFVCTQPADMRRGFDGLAAMTREIMRDDPFSGRLFVFFNRRRDRVKILFWDRTGLCLWYKRLEKGLFKPPATEDSAQHSVRVESAELMLILEGIELAGSRRRCRYRRRA